MDPTIANMLAQAAAQGGNIFIINCGGMGGSYGGEANEVEPIEGPGPDGSVQHESAEGEAPEPAEMAAPSPSKKPPAKVPPKKPAGLRGEKM